MHVFNGKGTSRGCSYREVLVAQHIRRRDLDMVRDIDTDIDIDMSMNA